MEGARRLQGQSIGVFNEGIGLLLFRWSALRTAVENEWGGRESRVKADQLVTDVLSWFTQSKEPLYIDDLEDILDQGMLSLNVEVEDGSIEEVAEKLMVMHEEFLDGNFSSFEDLRKANVEHRPHTAQIVNDGEDDSEEDGDDETMIVDGNSSSMTTEIPRSYSNNNSVNESRPNVSGEADDEWVVVSNRRNKGRKN
ncbi:pre-rRNA-processing protein TSR2 [Vigna unguiculata]|uniref:pre-rRNA-processing protein TSR2 n=1 Tax=Vigna unguiculata TaxID=3917 RepID=UPI001015EAA7|nr:pre-rRNA-processing protein TSR2 [Vigna unguiculata]